MDQELLNRFCDPDREKQRGPFSLGEYTYATNGHILVRVPRLVDVPEWEAVNEKAAAMFDGLDYAALDAALVDIPDFPQPDPEICTVCKGSSKISKCPECDGEGEVLLENDHHEYECTCKTCAGDGKVSGNESVCSSCHGSGKKAVWAKISVGCTHLSSHYLTMLKDLPGMRIAPTEPVKGNYFKWNEGDGLLMPMRA